MPSQKLQNDIWSFQGKPFNSTVIQVYTVTSNAEEAEVEQFYEDLQDLLELTLVILEPKKIKFLTVSIVSPSICQEVMGKDAMILVFGMLSFKSVFFTLLFHLHWEDF